MPEISKQISLRWGWRKELKCLVIQNGHGTFRLINKMPCIELDKTTGAPMEVKPFGNVDPVNLEECYDASIIINDASIGLDLNFEEKTTDNATLSKVISFMDTLETRLSTAMKSISDDFDLGEDSETATFYLEHHLDVLENEEIQSLFGSLDVSKDLFMSKLIIKRVGFYPEQEDAFVLIDIGLDPEVTDYLMSLTYDANFEMLYISMES